GDALARTDGTDAIARRLQLYHLFGECRFGFQQALRSWRDNQAAQAGPARATEAMVDYELAQGDPKAAGPLAGARPAVPPGRGARPSVPPALAARIAEAERAWQEERARASALAQIGRQWDVAVGRRTRLFLTAIIGTVWTVLPLAEPLRAFYGSYTGMLLVPA